MCLGQRQSGTTAAACSGNRLGPDDSAKLKTWSSSGPCSWLAQAGTNHVLPNAVATTACCTETANWNHHRRQAALAAVRRAGGARGALTRTSLSRQMGPSADQDRHDHVRLGLTNFHCLPKTLLPVRNLTSRGGAAMADTVEAKGQARPRAVVLTACYTTTDNMLHQRRPQPDAIARRTVGGARHTRMRSRSSTKRKTSPFQRPPTSEPSTTSFWGPPAANSGQAALLRRSTTRSSAPSMSAAQSC